MKKVNISEKFEQINDHWNPKIVGELNGQHVILVKIKGEFVFHKHDNEDELFLVIKGAIKIEFEDKFIELSKGEFIIIPRGILHRPVADEEAHLLLFEPASTSNTGDLKNDFTVESPEKM